MLNSFSNKSSRQVDRPNLDRPVPSPVKSKRDSKREHRNARVYEPHLKQDFPSRPPIARVQPERPAPIIDLPGLPPRPFTPSIEDQERMYGSPKWFGGAGTLLAKFRAPWESVLSPSKSSHPSTPKTPRPSTPKTGRPSTPQTGRPATPKTPRHFFDIPVSAKSREVKTLADFDDTLPPDEEFVYSPKLPADDIFKKDGFSDSPPHKFYDPPPLYRKNAPEGGLNAWRTLAGAFLIQFCTIGFLLTWNAFEDQYDHVWFTDFSPVAIRFILCFQLFLVFGSSLVAGKLADLGFFRHVVGAGSFIFALCLLILSFLSEGDFGKVFVFHAVGTGTGIGLCFVPTATVAAHYFKRHRGLAFGVVMSGGSFGSMIFPAALRASAASQGLNAGVRAIAIVSIILLLVANVLFVTPPKEEEPMFPVPRLDIVKYRSQMEYLFAAAATLIALFVVFFPALYLELMGLSHDVDPQSSFNTIVILSLTGLMGRVLAGFAADVLGVWNSLLVTSGLTGIMIISMPGIQGLKSLVAYAIFYGFFSGAWFSLMITALAAFATRLDEIGTRVGLVLTLASPLFLLSPILYNIILTPKRIWAIPSVIFGLLFVGVTVAIFFARVLMVKKASEMRRKVWIRWHMIPGVLVV